MSLELTESKDIREEEVVNLYRANKWSSANKPKQLVAALKNSHTLLTVRDKGKLIGLGNAISDGHLVVYYPHLLVLPEYHGKGIGKMIMHRFQEKFKHFHQQILVADGNAIEFYKHCGFSPAGNTQSMWIYTGNDH
ncbi:GNAT family N-acetyltransferase [Fulvivirgaceae bacterium BMA10]|uniref:GNAT family N-acetyltransferase n=1 Tax=Splendidivirga corallicola TaxID=3051826 RepID=A0ABT8KRK1_9BACT|nr:GNAT family N-acetyltransferase [Fulvivirgaceae bacterium BMA10]